MPNRILKESICTSDSIDSLSWFEEVLFYRLMVNCDDYGRFDGRSAVIKSRLFPLKDNITIKSIDAAINKLVSVELVALYEFEGKPYLHLPSWDKHQSVRAKRSKYPQPDETSVIMQADASKCKQMQADVPVIQSNPNPNPNPKADAFTAFADGDSDLLKSLNDFAQMRKAIKKPMTDRAKTMLCNKLVKLSNGDHAVMREMLDESTMHSWSDVYEPKSKKNTESKTTFTPGAGEMSAISQLQKFRNSLEVDT